MELLKKLYTFDAKSGNEEEFTKYVVSLLEEFGASVKMDGRGNVFAIKGESETYPCIAAHLDEVHDPRPKGFSVVEHDGHLFGFSSEKHDFHGIGADDKNGVWVALKCVESFDAIKVAFFVGEEVGCVGSGLCDMSFFDDVRFVIQCDRRNGSDLITNACGTNLSSSEFIEATKYKDFGYKATSGLSTDVWKLKDRGLSVSCLNISCGYYNPHTKYENTCISELDNCLDFVYNIVENCCDTYTHKNEEKRLAGNFGRFYGFHEEEEEEDEVFVVRKPNTHSVDWDFDSVKRIVKQASVAGVNMEMSDIVYYISKNNPSLIDRLGYGRIVELIYKAKAC